MARPVIALMTDFGTQDPYVGVMKGVLLSLCPDAALVDLTHDIAPQDVRAGAFALATAYSYFPRGTVFLVVVDPGVGSTRRPLAVRAGGYTFVGPDNGLLTYVLRSPTMLRAQEEGQMRAVVLQEQRFWLGGAVSTTFHGRDIFAPAAAHIAAGATLDAMGPAATLPLAALDGALLGYDPARGIVRGEVMYVDRFGNLVTNIGRLTWQQQAAQLALAPLYFGTQTPLADVPPFVAAEALVGVGGHVVGPVRPTYSSVGAGQMLALVGSSGFLEVAVNRGSAAAQLGVVAGDAVTLTTR